MAPPKAGKRASKAADLTPSNTLINIITLGEEEAVSAPIPSLNPTLTIERTVESPYPLEPLISNDTKANDNIDVEVKEEKLVWSEEMMEQLVDTLYEVFEKGGAADNSFKKAIFELAAHNVGKVYKGVLKVTHQQCKNKWGDTKAKWAYWKFLGEQSGFGWNEDTELYEAYDYVWTALNAAYPGILWHKTHVMPYRETISLILHDVQANGKGALTLEEPTAIDLRLASLKPLSSLSRASSVPPKTLYNRSRKRNIMETGDDEDDVTNGSNKKVDLGVAISSLSKEIARSRHAKETYESNQKRAIKLLEKEYKERLEIGAFLKAIVLFKDEGNAVTFLTLDDTEYRDLWLEMETNSHLK
jgi:hypothetical protein